MKRSKLKFGILSFLFFGAVFFINGIRVDAKTVIINDPSEWQSTVEDVTVDEIKLGKNIDLSSIITSTALPSIEIDSTERTLDLNGYELQVSSDSVNLKFTVSDGTITIKDSSESKTGKIVHTSLNNALITISYGKNVTKGNLVIDGGTYIGNTTSNSGIIYSQENTQITINKGVFDSIFLIRGNAPILKINNMTLYNSKATSSTTAASLYDPNMYGRVTYGYVVDSDHEALIKKADSSEKNIDTMTLVYNTVTQIDSTADYKDSIVVREKTGFIVNNVDFNESYGYNNKTQNVYIQNQGLSSLKIKNVTLDNYNYFEIIEGNSASVGAKETDSSWQIKVKDGLNIGTYSAILTVTDENDIEYTATVKITVSKRQLMNLSIGFDDNLTYGESKIEPTIGGLDGVDKSDYKIEYTKTGTENWSTTRPLVVGDYTIRLTITGSNYVESSASSEFKILPTEKVVKIVASSSSHVYNGKPYSDNGFTVYFDGNIVQDGKLLYNDTVSKILVIGAVKDVKDNKDKNNIVDRESITITNRDCYKNIEIVDGTISIEPISTPIIVTAGSATKKFDNTVLTNTTFKYTDNILVDGDKMIAAITGSQFYVGTSSNVIMDVQIIRDNIDVTSNYTLAPYVNGTLKIEPVEQNITINKNINIKVGGTLTVDELKSLLNCNIDNYSIRYVSGDFGTFNQDNGFTAGNTAGQVEMEVIAPAIDKNNDGTDEYLETTSTFYINVEEKDIVNLSGLTYNDKYYDGNEIIPTGTLIIEDNKVSQDEIEILYVGTNGTNYSSSEAPKNAGTYEVTYKISDNNKTYAGSVTYTFTIKKAQVAVPSYESISLVYNGEMQGYSFAYNRNVIELSGVYEAVNAGNYSFTWSLKDTDNYEWMDGTTEPVITNWEITKATPEYTVPTNLTGVKGQTLLEISLDGRFTWNDPSEKLLAGTHTYKATYTPEDTENHKIVDDIDITVVAKDTFVITATVIEGEGTIDTPKSEIIEGSIVEVTFTPNAGYMINKVTVNGNEVEVTDNKLKLTIEENKNIEVSYKKIPFVIVVKDTSNAVITPKGTISVLYGDSQEFTIIANKGYKLKRVLVNDTDRLSDMEGNKLVISNITSDTTVEVVVEEISYNVVEQDSTVRKNNNAKFRIDADYNLFNNNVFVDDVLVDSKNYTVEQGSTIITLDKEYINTLSVGTHTLKVTFSDGGEAITEFTVLEAITDGNDSNPSTGDNIETYIITFVISLSGLVGLIYVGKKYLNKKVS